MKRYFKSLIRAFGKTVLKHPFLRLYVYPKNEFGVSKSCSENLFCKKLLIAMPRCKTNVIVVKYGRKIFEISSENSSFVIALHLMHF